MNTRARRKTPTKKYKDAVPTIANGVEYKSKIEAAWSRIFDQLGWHYDYEKEFRDGWNPDFHVSAPNQTGCCLLTEVKSGLGEFTPDINTKMTAAKLDTRNEVLLKVWDAFPMLTQTGWQELGHVGVWDWFSGSHPQWVWGNALLIWNAYGLDAEGRFGRWELHHSSFAIDLLWHPIAPDVKRNWLGDVVPDTHFEPPRETSR